MEDSSSKAHRILLVEDNAGDARLVELMLSELTDAEYHLTVAETMSQALALLEENEFEASLLDLTLPDGEGLDNIAVLKEAADNLPIVVLSGRFDENFAVEAVQAGAQDYLVKGEIDEKRLARTLNYAIVRKHQQDELRYLAHHDQLTDLANRSLFRIRLEHAMHCAKRRGEIVALLFIDLDHFKPINDELGHEVGDALLKAVAERLTNSVREVDTVGRLGGDEFAIILEGIKFANNVSLVADKIISLMANPFIVPDHQLNISASIGIALYPEFGTDIDTLLRNADDLMYKAKSYGGNQYVLSGADEMDDAETSSVKPQSPEVLPRAS